MCTAYFVLKKCFIFPRLFSSLIIQSCCNQYVKLNVKTYIARKLEVWLLFFLLHVKQVAQQIKNFLAVSRCTYIYKIESVGHVGYKINLNNILHK